jgi:hypothetical protein
MVAERQAMGAIGGRSLLLMDSISSLHPEDAGCVVVSGSHGGASAGRLARGRGLAAAVFNDAGVGKDGAGVAALAMLEEGGTPAAAVGHLSARIGDARDAWEHGVVSHANGPALALGLAPGRPLAAAIAAAFGAAPPPPAPMTADGAAELLRLRDGVYATDLLIAAVGWLDLFSWLAAHPSDLDGLCSGLGLARRPAGVMCSLLAAMGLLESAEGVMRPTPLAAERLTAGRPGDLSAYLAVLRERPACRELLGVLRTDEPAAWAGAGAGAEWAERLGEAAFADAFTAAMEGRAAVLAPALADALADVPAAHVLDVAGGSGAYARALVERRGLRATVLERPPVDGAARASLRERGWADRVEVVGADMFADPLPAGPDLHLYSHVLHDWDEGAVSRLLAASFAALPSDGHVVDHDAHLDPDRRGPLAVARYSALIVHSTRGRCYSSAEIAEMMAAAGFVEPSLRPTAADRSAVVARKP